MKALRALRVATLAWSVAVGAQAEPLPPLPASFIGARTETIAEIEIDAIYFSRGAHALEPRDSETLASLGRRLAGLAIYVVVDAYTDQDGDAAANLALSQRRAEACAAALADGTGFPATQLLTVGYGEAAAQGATAAEKAGDRRVAFRVLRLLSQPPERATLLDELRVRGVRFVERGAAVTPRPAATAEAARAATEFQPPLFAGLLLHGGGSVHEQTGRGGGFGLRLLGSVWPLGEATTVALDAWQGTFGTTRPSPGSARLSYAGIGIAARLYGTRIVSGNVVGTLGALSSAFTPGPADDGLPSRVAAAASVGGLVLLRHPKVPLGFGAGPSLSFGARGGVLSLSAGVVLLAD